MRLAERPCGPLGRDSAGDERVLDDVLGVVEIDEGMVPDLAVDEKGGQHEASADDRQQADRGPGLATITGGGGSARH